MSKKSKNDNPSLTVPNYEALVTIEEVEEELTRRKNTLIGKDRIDFTIRESKKEYNAAINEQLRDLKEEREHEITVISALEDRKKQILNGNIFPTH